MRGERLSRQSLEVYFVIEVLGKGDGFSFFNLFGALTQDLFIHVVADPPIGRGLKPIDDEFVGVALDWFKGIGQGIGAASHRRL